MDSTDSDIAVIQEEAARALGGLAAADTLRGLLRKQGEYHTALWRLSAELGWLGMSLPEDVGGVGLGLAERCAIAEELGRALGSAPFTASTCAMSAIARFGSDDQRAGLLPAAIAGETILTVACLEPGAGDPPAHPKARFADGRLSGVKAAVSAGAFADHALVHVSTADGAAAVAVVDLRRAGVTRTVLDTLDNSRGYADLAFDGAAASLLAGDDVLGALLDELAVVTAFEQVGGAEACLFAARDYAQQRRVFGQPIGAFQAVKHGLADLYVLVQIARGAARSALQAPAAEFRLAAAAARTAAIRAYDLCAQEGIQLHGGIGATWQADQHLHYRRARALALEWAGEPYWREILLNQVLIQGAAA
jgi:alkylation response protein AidB-like acyl-CoA dehydrogenase